MLPDRVTVPPPLPLCAVREMTPGKMRGCTPLMWICPPLSSDGCGDGSNGGSGHVDDDDAGGSMPDNDGDVGNDDGDTRLVLARVRTLAMMPSGCCWW